MWYAQYNAHAINQQINRSGSPPRSHIASLIFVAMHEPRPCMVVCIIQLHLFLCNHTLNNECWLSEVPISLAVSSWLLMTDRWDGSPEVSDFCVNLLPGIQLPCRIYCTIQNTIAGTSSRKVFVKKAAGWWETPSFVSYIVIKWRQ